MSVLDNVSIRDSVSKFFKEVPGRLESLYDDCGEIDYDLVMHSAKELSEKFGSSPEEVEAEIRKFAKRAAIARSRLDWDCPQIIAGDIARQIKVVYYQGEWYEYYDGWYHTGHCEDIEAYVTDFCQLAAKCEHVARVSNQEKNQKLPKVTTAIKSNVITNMKSDSLVRSYIQIPAWINGATGPNPSYLHCTRNAILDIQKLASGDQSGVMEASHNFFSRSGSDCEYDPRAKCPIFMSMIMDQWKEYPATVRQFQKLCGLMLVRNTDHQHVFLMTGPTRSSKGLMLQVLSWLAGESSTYATSTTSLDSNFSMEPSVGCRLMTIEN